MHQHIRSLRIGIVILAAGCDSTVERFEVMPTQATRESFTDLIEFDSLPPETREIYDAIFDGKLAGAEAAQFQPLLDSAQQINRRELFTLYKFQLTDFGRPYEEVEAEGVPVMFVMVQKEYGHVYKCDIAEGCF